jgi:hypothetical protein
MRCSPCEGTTWIRIDDRTVRPCEHCRPGTYRSWSAGDLNVTRSLWRPRMAIRDIPSTEAPPTASGTAWRATRAGYCAVCTAPIEIGSWMAIDGRKRPVHRDCGAE